MADGPILTCLHCISLMFKTVVPCNALWLFGRIKGDATEHSIKHKTRYTNERYYVRVLLALHSRPLGSHTASHINQDALTRATEVLSVKGQSHTRLTKVFS